MNEIINELSKPVWWVSVVIAGIIINLISAYLKTRLDKTLSSASAWWASQSAKRKKDWSERVERISEGGVELASEIAEESRQRLQSIQVLLLAILLLLQLVLMESIRADVPREIKVAFLGVSSALLFASFMSLQSAIRTARAITAARMSAKWPSKRMPNGAA
jgi:hypothetical protein